MGGEGKPTQEQMREVGARVWMGGGSLRGSLRASGGWVENANESSWGTGNVAGEEGQRDRL